jgi:glycosyltransferase involved in cell wall biosynthesis
MKRIAIIRGANLNKFEMQTLEGLKSDFAIDAFCSARNNFRLDGIDLPIHRLGGVELFWPGFLGKYRRYYNFLFDFLLETSQPMFGLTRQLRGFDILHVADVSYYYSYQAAKAKDEFGSRLVASHSENLPFFFGRNRWSRKRIDWTVSQVDLFLPRTERAREVLLLMGVPEEKTRVVPYGVDTQFFRPSAKDTSVARTYGVGKDELVILFIGRLARSKGVMELIYALKRLTDDPRLRQSRIRLLLIGSGPLTGKVRELTLRLNLGSQVTMISELQYEKMPEVYNLADIFVLPSIPTRWGQEKFGMVLIESMACGKPVISTLCGSIPEVVGDAGVLVQPADHLSLYQAMRKLVLDDGLRTELGGLARQRALQHFDRRKCAAKIREAYQTVLQL